MNIKIRKSKQQPKQKISRTITNRNREQRAQANPAGAIQTMKNLSQTLIKGVEKMGKSNDSISKDAIRFATSYADPTLDKPSSLPLQPTLPHQQVTVKTFVTASTNDSGVGWAALRPAGMIVNSFGCLTSSITTSGPEPNWANGVLTTSNSPFQISDFQPSETTGGKTFRIVSMVLRARYIGTTLNAAGTVFTFQLTPGIQGPYDGGVVGFTPQLIRSYGNYKEKSFRGSSWHSVTRHLIRAEDSLIQCLSPNNQGPNFQYLLNQSSGQVSFDNTSSMLIYIKAEANQPFEVEAIGHFEVIGPNLSYRTMISSNEEFVHKVRDGYAKRRMQDITTPDHSVCQKPTSSGGWAPVVETMIKEGVKLIPSLIEMFA